MQEKKKSRPSPLSRNPHVRRDENGDMQLVLQVVLGTLDYNVLLVSNDFNHLVQEMKNGLKMDVCILSVDNPGLLSGQVCQELRQLYSPLKILGTSMNNSKLIKKKAIACDFNGFYSKGEPIENLVSILNNFRN